MIQLCDETGPTFWDTGNSGTIPQSFSDPTTQYTNDPTPFTTDAEVEADAPTGQMNSFSSHVNSPEETLWQSLGSLPDIYQGAVADNPLLPGFNPSAPYISVHHELDPFFIPEAQSLTALFQGALNASVPTVQHGHERGGTHAISGVDENALAAPTVAQMSRHMPPYYWSQMPEEQTLARLKQVQKTHVPFPTLSTFTPPVFNLSQWPMIQPHQCDSFQPLASGPWPLNNDFYDPLAATNPLVWGIGQPNEISPTHPTYPGQSAHSQTAVPYAMHVHPDTADYTSMLAVPYSQGSCATQSLSGNVVLPLLVHPPYDTKVDNWHTPSKRKADEDIGAVDAGPSPPPVGTNMSKRRRVESISIERNKFGAYAKVDANATVMPKPLSDRYPVDICDVDGAGAGRPQTRKYGIMEIDDSYGTRSARISKELPNHLTCVRACEWTDRPCGLYIEVCKDRISDHLLKWHGVAQDVKILCEFQGCDGKPLKTLGRHIETVHFGTSWECSSCQKGLSRSDAVSRHRKTCEGALAGHTTVTARKVVSGYIIPARKFEAA